MRAVGESRKKKKELISKLKDDVKISIVSSTVWNEKLRIIQAAIASEEEISKLGYNLKRKVLNF